VRGGSGGGEGGRSGVRGEGRCVSERECNEGLQSWANCRSSIRVTIQATSQHMTGCAPFSLPNLQRAFVLPVPTSYPTILQPILQLNLPMPIPKAQYQKPNTTITHVPKIRLITHVPRSVRVELVAPYILIALSCNANFTMSGTIPNPRPFPWPLMFEAGKSKGGRQKGRWKETGEWMSILVGWLHQRGPSLHQRTHTPAHTPLGKYEPHVPKVQPLPLTHSTPAPQAAPLPCAQGARPLLLLSVR
jgi:hypothetical protein